MPSITPGLIEGGEVAALESAVIARAMVKYTPGMEKLDENGQPMVWLLLKALYGLKQSGNRWMMLLIKVLKKLGMKQSMADTHVTVVQDGPHDGDLLYTLVRRVNKVLRSIFVKATKPS